MTVVEVALQDGTRFTLRPIRPEDEPAMVRFHRSLSDRSVYLRYFHQISLSERVAHERLAGVCSTGQERAIVLVAETEDKDIAGVGRLMRDETNNASAEFAVIVSDAWQDRGVGSALLERLIAIAGEEGLSRVTGYVLADNNAMLDLCQRLGFVLGLPNGGVVDVTLDLRSPPAA